METPYSFRNTQEFEDFLKHEGGELARETANCLQAMMPGTEGSRQLGVTISANPAAQSYEHGIIASIFFLGPVFGEFILSADAEVARRLFGPMLQGLPEPEQSQMIGEALAEVLNQCAGKRIQSLNRIFKRLTITVPKVTQGKVTYRGVHSATTTLATEHGDLGVSLYIDQMQTDLAEAHRDMIKQLKDTNTDLERANVKLKDQQLQLVQSEKMASLGLMAAGVAHEINNPLSYVMSNTETLSSYVEITTRLIGGYSRFLKLFAGMQSIEAKTELEQIRVFEEQAEIEYVTSDSQKLIEDSRTGLDRIRKIVNGLKRFSRQEESGSKVTQINDEILNTLELLRNELKYRCTVETDLGPVSELLCLPNELSQVFVNLLINAAQAMPKGGGKILISTRVENEHLTIRFRDTGMGMSPEVMQKIFQPFFTTKPVGQGTGLGLAISFGIVERHGGTIEVESTPGEGSVFTIRLPYSKSGPNSV